MRPLLVLIVLGAWLLLGPLAMAFESCDGVCEGPCGVLPAVASTVPSEAILARSTDRTVPARHDLPGIPARVLERPPKFLPRFA